jgi:hypothetical protein
MPAQCALARHSADDVKPHTVATADAESRAAAGAGGAARRALHRTPRYRLHVWCSNLVELIRLTGGLVFDRAMDGWDVQVLTSDCADHRPLRILGVRHPPNSTPVTDFPATATMATDEQRWVDSRIIQTVTGDVVLTVSDVFGAAGLMPRGAYLEYECSRAARLFKTHALIAADASPAGIADTELFRIRDRGDSDVPATSSTLSRLSPRS